MGHSSLLGIETAAPEPAGRDVGRLGPSDTSDSASDLAGVDATDEFTATGIDAELPEDAPDIGVDRVVDVAGAGASDDTLSDDEDPDLAFIDEAQAGEPLEDEEADDVEGDVEGDGHPEVSATADIPQPGKPNPEPDVPAPPRHPGEDDVPVYEEDIPSDGEDPETRRPGRAALLRRR
jgi:hypothetical protein